MRGTLLEIRDMSVGVGDKLILRDINLKINKGEIHVVMGPNGSGKSTLANSIMNHPKYILRKGSIFFEGNDITEDKVDERARKGIFMSFQNPLEVAGITVGNFLRSAVSAREGSQMSLVKFGREIGKQMEALDMKPEYIDRKSKWLQSVLLYVFELCQTELPDPAKYESLLDSKMVVSSFF